jgi:acyl-CoA dehydrogenase
MADFGLNEEERMVQQLAHEFAVKEIRPVAAYYDEHEELPRDVMLNKQRTLGWHDGTGRVDAGVAGRHRAFLGRQRHRHSISSTAWRWRHHGHRGGPEAVVPQVRQLDRQAGAFGRWIKLGRRQHFDDGCRDGGDILNGTKRFITNGGIADVHVIFATEDKSKKWGGLCAFAIEKGTPGMSMGTVWKKMGIRASWTADVVLDDCRVPARNRLGPEPGAPPSAGGGGGGAIGALGALERTRPMIGCLALGVGRAAFEYAVDYSRERIQFGRPLIANQAIAFKLADMAIELDAARSHLATWMAATGVPFLHGGQHGEGIPIGRRRSVVEAVQVLGGYGYVSEFPVEVDARRRYSRSSKAQGDQRLVISRTIGNQSR